jgi:hypothetical protein
MARGDGKSSIKTVQVRLLRTRSRIALVSRKRYSPLCGTNSANGAFLRLGGAGRTWGGWYLQGKQRTQLADWLGSGPKLPPSSVVWKRWDDVLIS